MNINNLASTLQLAQPEKIEIERCISTYSTNIFSLHLINLLKRVKNAIRHLWGDSDWQRAQSILQQKVIIFLQKGFFEESEKKLIEEKAQILSEFALRHLITRKSIEELHQSQYLIAQNKWPKVANLSINEIFGRVIFGKKGDLLEPDFETIFANVKKRHGESIMIERQENDANPTGAELFDSFIEQKKNQLQEQEADDAMDDKSSTQSEIDVSQEDKNKVASGESTEDERDDETSAQSDQNGEKTDLKTEIVEKDSRSSTSNVETPQNSPMSFVPVIEGTDVDIIQDQLNFQKIGKEQVVSTALDSTRSKDATLLPNNNNNLTETPTNKKKKKNKKKSTPQATNVKKVEESQNNNSPTFSVLEKKVCVFLKLKYSDLTKTEYKANIFLESKNLRSLHVEFCNKPLVGQIIDYQSFINALGGVYEKTHFIRSTTLNTNTEEDAFDEALAKGSCAKDKNGNYTGEAFCISKEGMLEIIKVAGLHRKEQQTNKKK